MSIVCRLFVYRHEVQQCNKRALHKQHGGEQALHKRFGEPPVRSLQVLFNPCTSRACIGGVSGRRKQSLFTLLPQWWGPTSSRRLTQFLNEFGPRTSWQPSMLKSSRHHLEIVHISIATILMVVHIVRKFACKDILCI